MSHRPLPTTATTIPAAMMVPMTSQASNGRKNFMAGGYKTMSRAQACLPLL